MRIRIAGIVLIISALLLVGVGLSLRTSRNEPRADLVGPTVKPTATTVSTTSAIVTTTTRARTPQPSTGDSQSAKQGVFAAGFVKVPPRRLSIPAIGVDVPVESVGLANDGSMEIPGATEAGWYRFGPTPGSSMGSSVIAAHVDFDGAAGPFFNLRRLNVGDTLVVTDGATNVHRFVVTERFQLPKDRLPVTDLFRTDGTPTLTLITCGGAFDTSSRHYQDNIIIRAVPAST